RYRVEALARADQTRHHAADAEHITTLQTEDQVTIINRGQVFARVIDRAADRSGAARWIAAIDNGACQTAWRTTESLIPVRAIFGVSPIKIQVWVGIVEIEYTCLCHAAGCECCRTNKVLHDLACTWCFIRNFSHGIPWIVELVKRAAPSFG